MDLSAWARLFTQLSDLQQLYDQVRVHEDRLSSLERRMATEEATSARIDAVTNNLANDVVEIRQTLADLRTAVNSNNQAAIESAMDRVSSHIDTLEQAENVLRALPSEPAPTAAAGAVPSADVSASPQSAQASGTAGGEQSGESA